MARLCSALICALVCTVALAVPATAAEVSVYGSTTMIRPTDGGTGTTEAEITAARNEFEAFQIKIAGGLNAVDIALTTPLTRVGGGGTIPAGNVQFFREGYYTVGRPSDGELFGADPCAGECRVPDVLIPDVDAFDGQQRNAFTHANFQLDIPAGENRVAWVDVLVPQNAAAGRYEGVVRVTGQGGFSRDIPVGLKVLAATLPSTSSLEGAFSITFQKLCPAHGGCPAGGVDAWDLYARYARLALEHRMSLDRPAFGDPGNDLARWRTEAGEFLSGTSNARLPGAKLTGVVLNTFFAGVMDDYHREAKTLGVVDKVAFYCDETGSSPAAWTACDDAYDVAKAEWAKEGATPMHMAKIGTDDELAWARAENYGVAFAVDRLIPIINFFAPHAAPYPGDRPAYDPYLAERERNDLWAYQSCMSSGCTDEYTNHPIWHGWPSYHIDQPVSEHRAMPWLLHTHDVTGEYYFETVMDLSTAWGGCAGRPLGCLYNEGGNGDGTFFYPGTPARIGGTSHIPVESIRLKRVRDGREDYEWLELAGIAGKAVEARTIARGLFPKLSDAVATQGELDSARAALAPLISGDAPPAGPECQGKPVTENGTDASETLSGGPVEDVLSGRGGDDRLEGFPSDDTLCGDEGDDTILPGDGIDIADGGTGVDTADFTQGSPGVVADLGIGSTSGPSGADQLIAIENLTGTPGIDSLVGNEQANRLVGADGADEITGGPGGDLLDGGPGNDTILAADGEQDDVNCGAGADEVMADALDFVSANCEVVDTSGPLCQGRPATTGTNLADMLTGGLGADALSALAGDDVVRGLAGGDALCGDLGYDTLLGGPGDDVLDGGEGADLADFDDAAQTVLVDLKAGTASGDGSDLLVSVSDVAGGPGNDVLAGTATANHLMGRTGNDDLQGREGNDRLDGGDGNDTLRGGSGNDRLDGEGGIDELSYELSPAGVSVDLSVGTATGDGTDTLFGFEDVTGSDGPDTIMGGAGANYIAGRGGADTIDGAGGPDFLSAGAGDDTLLARDGVADRVACGDGDDLVTADAGDTVEADCETVDRGEVVVPTPVPTPGPTSTPTPGPVVDRTAPKLSARVLSVRRLLRFRLTASERCRYVAELRLSAADARRLKLPRRLATRTGSAPGASVVLRLTARARGRLSRVRSFRATLSVRGVDSAGNAATIRRMVRLKR